VGEWRKCCEQNFYKSLDHRQFIFKEVQKKQYPNKKQIEELKKIQSVPAKEKSLNELKGGSSKQHEFYCTYSSFNMGNLQVYNNEALSQSEFQTDAPINMADYSRDYLVEHAD